MLSFPHLQDPGQRRRTCLIIYGVILVNNLQLGSNEAPSILRDGSDANPGSLLCTNRRASKRSMFTASSHSQVLTLTFGLPLGSTSIRLPP
jgi:hypothetical protein